MQIQIRSSLKGRWALRKGYILLQKWCSKILLLSLDVPKLITYHLNNWRCTTVWNSTCEKAFLPNNKCINRQLSDLLRWALALKSKCRTPSYPQSHEWAVKKVTEVNDRPRTSLYVACGDGRGGGGDSNMPQNLKNKMFSSTLYNYVFTNKSISYWRFYFCLNYCLVFLRHD